MREIIIQYDNLRGHLFNEKETVFYKTWFAVYMKDLVHLAASQRLDLTERCLRVPSI